MIKLSLHRALFNKKPCISCDQTLVPRLCSTFPYLLLLWRHYVCHHYWLVDILLQQSSTVSVPNIDIRGYLCRRQGNSVLCPSAQNLAFCLKLSPRLKSKVIWSEISVYPIKLLMHTSCSLNFIMLFCMSKLKAFIHWMYTFSISSYLDSFIFFGIQITYLCNSSQCFDLTLLIIHFIYFIVCLIQHSIAGSSSIPSIFAYSATPSGKLFFLYLRLNQLQEPSFYWTYISQPLVIILIIIVPFLVFKKLRLGYGAPNNLWYMISSIWIWRLPSSSTWSMMFLEETNCMGVSLIICW